MKCSRCKKPLTARQQAAIRQLYVQQHLPVLETAKRLRLTGYSVTRFLRERGVLRSQGGLKKFSWEDRQKLESELATATNAVLAQKYGVTGEAIRQIRQRLGYPSSGIIRHEWAMRARAERKEQKRLARQRARELRKQERRARQLAAINRLSKRWMSGALLWELAQEYGVSLAALCQRINHARKLYPEKIPYRFPPRSPRVKGAGAIQRP